MLEAVYRVSYHALFVAGLSAGSSCNALELLGSLCCRFVYCVICRQVHFLTEFELQCSWVAGLSAGQSGKSVCRSGWQICLPAWWQVWSTELVGKFCLPVFVGIFVYRLSGKFYLPVGSNYNEVFEAMYCLSCNALCTLDASRTVDIVFGGVRWVWFCEDCLTVRSVYSLLLMIVRGP